jgi:hypothetical protein
MLSEEEIMKIWNKQFADVDAVLNSDEIDDKEGEEEAIDLEYLEKEDFCQQNKEKLLIQDLDFIDKETN